MIFRDVQTRPYEPLRLGPVAWSEQQLVYVRIADLVIINPTAMLRALVEPPDDRTPRVVLADGTFYLEGGESHVLRSALAGAETISAHIVWIKKKRK